MKRVNRSYPPEFRQAAVQQVVGGGRSVPAVARSLEMSAKTLANWVGRARRGEAPTAVSARGPVSEVEAELARLRQEVAKLRMEKEILKKAACGVGPPKYCATSTRRLPTPIFFHHPEWPQLQ